jgi:hypothetical protein
MDTLIDKNKPIFIIAHKYYRGYESYVEYYINNIKKFYEEALVIIVDNNSTYVEDIFSNLRKYDNVILLENNIDCKFEIGAYRVGLKYVIDNNLLNEYSYVVLTQDTFILKNKLDFNLLNEQNITAAPINSFTMDDIFKDIRDEILIKLGLFNNLDKITFCWCCSFIVSTTKIEQLLNYFKDIIITTRDESGAAERYLARILWELNDYKNNDIDGDMAALKYSWNGKINPSPKYDCHNVNIYDEKITTYFVKKTQQKTERTNDK